MTSRDVREEIQSQIRDIREKGAKRQTEKRRQWDMRDERLRD